MWALLKKWDARVNRRIVGPKWHKRTDERMVWFAFLEKSDVNPHWHLLVSLDHDHLGDSNRRKRTDAFPKVADQVWQDLLARGSVDVQEVKDTGVNRYVTKSLDPKLARHHVIYSEFFSIN